MPFLHLLNNGWVWKYVDSLRNTHNVALSHLLFHSRGRFPFIHTDPFMLYIDKLHSGECQPNKTDINFWEVTWRDFHLLAPCVFSYKLTRLRGNKIVTTISVATQETAQLKVSVQRFKTIVPVAARSPTTLWHNTICCLHPDSCKWNHL